jgi:hypothetical protein
MDIQTLEQIAENICEDFEAYAPPVPIELMLQKPLVGMWEEVDVAKLSGTFLSVAERYSPRMSLSRLLARHIAASDWGKAQGINAILGNETLLNAFARMLIMPKEMLTGLTSNMRNPQTISMHFEVPESDARERLLELS